MWGANPALTIVTITMPPTVPPQQRPRCRSTLPTLLSAPCLHGAHGEQHVLRGRALRPAAVLLKCHEPNEEDVEHLQLKPHDLRTFKPWNPQKIYRKQILFDNNQIKHIHEPKFYTPTKR